MGRDVDSIIRDLVEIAVKNTREQEMQKVRPRAEDAAEERVLDALLPGVPAGRGQRRQLHAPALPQDAARGQARRQGNRDRRRAGHGQHGDPRPARHGGAHAADPGHVRQPRQSRAASGARCRSARPAPDHRRGGRQARERGGDAPARRALGRGERDRVPRRDRQDREPRRDAGRRRLPPGRAARPAAADRGHVGHHQVRNDPHRPHPLHRERRLPPRAALGPHPRAAGTAADPRRALEPFGRGLRADPHRHRRVPHAPVPGSPRHRGRRARRSRPKACAGSRRSRSR